jgi:mRNA-degrading endonuclease RelE of RelBE toxin-antitoxin system
VIGIRAGDYRVEEERPVVLVVDVGNRESIYGP